MISASKLIDISGTDKEYVSYENEENKEIHGYYLSSRFYEMFYVKPLDIC